MFTLIYNHNFETEISQNFSFTIDLKIGILEHFLKICQALDPRHFSSAIYQPLCFVLLASMAATHVKVKASLNRKKLMFAVADEESHLLVTAFRPNNAIVTLHIFWEIKIFSSMCYILYFFSA